MHTYTTSVSLENMCSLHNSAFETSNATTSSTTEQQRSPVERKKNVLTRDDSGVFSSPSPLTPSRGPVFPLPPPSTCVTSTTASAFTSSGAASPPTMSASSRPEEIVSAEQGVSAAAAGGDDVVQSDGLLPPTEDSVLLMAFSCRETLGHDHWDNCSHAHCTTIRNQWQHLSSCGRLCQHCLAFQRRVLLHSAYCHRPSCPISLCADAKQQLGGVSNHKRPMTIQRSNSLQSSIGSPRPPQFLSLNNQGSLDDMSPVSPLNYPSFPREFWEVGAGNLPRHLQESYSLRATDILREMEVDGPLDKFSEKPNPLPAATATTMTGQGSKFAVGGGVLSPIKEHPCVDDCPSQTILHPLEPEILTQGRDGRYLHLRDYDICDHLGSGGFGTCTCARDHETKKMFVIKSNKFSEENMVDTLKGESDILSRIPQHSNITTFLGAILEEKGSKEGPERHCRLMLELAEHGSLAAMLVNEEDGPEPLPLEQSLFYLYQILQGVFHLHSLSILHLDIKAENVLVLEDGRRIKLTDFGTAAHIDDIVSCVSKLKGVTPHFTSPEIIKGDIPSFSSDIWSTVCVLIQLLTAEFPGGSKVSRESMIYTLGTYVDKDIEKLIYLSQMEVEEEVKDIFRDTLCVDPRSRPSALQLLAYPALRNACNYEKYFDIDCTMFSEEVTTQEGAESACPTPPTSLPHLIVGQPDGDVSLDIPTRRNQSEVYTVDLNDSGIDTPGQETFPLQRGGGGMNLQAMNLREGIICEDREGEERLTSIPNRTHSHPNPPVDYSAIASQYRRRSMSATINRPSTSAALEYTGLKFGCCYADTNEDFFSLPAKSSCGFMVQSQKVRPNFVHLIHSNSAPMVMSDEERGAAASGLGEKQSGGGGGGVVSGRLRRSSSEVYVDRGPEIDTPEEKKKRELALAAATAKEAEEQEAQVAANLAALRLEQPHPSREEAWPQRNHTPSSTADQSDRGRGQRAGENGPTAGRGSPMPYAQTTQKRDRNGGYVQETLV